jgi:hypothetical protein
VRHIRPTAGWTIVMDEPAVPQVGGATTGSPSPSCLADVVRMVSCCLDEVSHGQKRVCMILGSTEDDTEPLIGIRASTPTIIPPGGHRRQQQHFDRDRQSNVSGGTATLAGVHGPCSTGELVVGHITVLYQKLLRPRASANACSDEA